MSEIAKQLRELREQNGKRLSDIADEVGISVAYLSDIERGRRATLDAAQATLNKILSCYGMELVCEIRVKKQ